jgi:hypothetical protein
VHLPPSFRQAIDHHERIHDDPGDGRFELVQVQPYRYRYSFFLVDDVAVLSSNGFAEQTSSESGSERARRSGIRRDSGGTICRRLTA